MPIDNLDSSPELILARARAGSNQDRLSLELSLLTSDSVPSADANANSAGTSSSVTSSTSLVTVGGSGGGQTFPCFIGGTKIKGKDEDFEIQNIQKDFVVLAFNPETREKGYCKVTEIFIHEVTQYLQIELENGILYITPEHLVYDGEGFKAIGEFKENDWLFTFDFIVSPIIKITEIIGDPFLVYNIETEYQTYFAEGFAVHNLKSPDDPL